MKRKDMIKIMCDSFYFENKDIFDDPSKRLNMFDTVNGMFAVLEKMEELGMAPPEAKPFLDFLGNKGDLYIIKNNITGEEIKTPNLDFLKDHSNRYWEEDTKEEIDE